MKIIKKTDWNAVVLFITALFFRLICYWQPVLHKFRCDDFGTVIYPAYAAGYDWSAFVSGTDYYYGFGYYWIFAPMFRLISSPKILLLSITVINGILIALISCFLYHLLVKYLSFPRELTTAMFAFLPTMYQGDNLVGGGYWYRTDNEVPVFLVCWLVVWLLLKAREKVEGSLKTRVFLSLGMSLLLCWGLTVHERLLALALAVILTEGLLFLLKKKWLFQPVAFFTSFAAGFVLQRYLRKLVIGALWAGNTPGKNTSAFSRVSFWFLQSLDAVKTFFILFFGNLYNFIQKGFGLPAFAIVLVFLWVGKQLPILRKKYFEKDEAVASSWIGSSMLIMLVFGICVLITLTGLAVRWGALLCEGLRTGEIVYEYKGICYSRYYFVFIGPVIFGVLTYFYHHMPLRHEVKEAVWGVFLGIELLFFFEIFPYCVRAKTLTDSNLYVKRAFGIHNLYLFSDEIQMAESMLLVITVMFLASLGVKHHKRREKGKKYLRILAVFLMLVFGMNRVGLVIGQQVLRNVGVSFHFYEGENVAEAVSALEEEGLLPDKVYLPNTNWSFGVQFMNREVSYISGSPSEDQLGEDTLVLSKSKNVRKYLDAGYEQVKLGKYRAYTNNPKTAEALRGLRAGKS